MNLTHRLMTLLFMASQCAQAQFIPRFDLQGHRGARGLYPENTIPGFLVALDRGVSTIELDVVLTADKQVVVSHEPWISASICLDSTGNEIPPSAEKKYNIYKMTYDEVRSFDCGIRGNPEFPDQLKISATKPLLVDVIKAVEHYVKDYTGYEVDYNIEIKSDPQGDGLFHPEPQAFSDTVHHLIDQYLPWRRVLIQSFDVRVLRYWHKKYPAVRLSLLVENLRSPESNLARLGFVPNIYSPAFKLLSKQKVDYLHGRGLRVVAWTVNEPADMLRLRSWGVDGIITDYPDRATRLGLSPVNVLKGKSQNRR